MIYGLATCSFRLTDGRPWTLSEAFPANQADLAGKGNWACVSPGERTGPNCRETASALVLSPVTEVQVRMDQSVRRAADGRYGTVCTVHSTRTRQGQISTVQERLVARGQARVLRGTGALPLRNKRRYEKWGRDWPSRWTLAASISSHPHPGKKQRQFGEIIFCARSERSDVLVWYRARIIEKPDQIGDIRYP